MWHWFEGICTKREKQILAIQKLFNKYHVARMKFNFQKNIGYIQMASNGEWVTYWEIYYIHPGKYSGGASTPLTKWKKKGIRKSQSPSVRILRGSSVCFSLGGIY